jgi:hypothetical protein
MLECSALPFSLHLIVLLQGELIWKINQLNWLITEMKHILKITLFLKIEKQEQ